MKANTLKYKLNNSIIGSALKQRQKTNFFLTFNIDDHRTDQKLRKKRTQIAEPFFFFEKAFR